MFHQRGPLNMSITPIFRGNIQRKYSEWIINLTLQLSHQVMPPISLLGTGERERWGIVLPVENCSVYTIIRIRIIIFSRVCSSAVRWSPPRVDCWDLVLPPAGSHAPAYSNSETSHLIRTAIFTLAEPAWEPFLPWDLLTNSLHWNESDCPLNKPQFYKTLKNCIRR